MFMDCGEGVEAQTGCDFLVGRGVSVLLGEAGEEVDYFFLPPRDSHGGIVANKKRIASTKIDSGQNCGLLTEGQSGTKPLDLKPSEVVTPATNRNERPCRSQSVERNEGGGDPAGRWFSEWQDA